MDTRDATIAWWYTMKNGDFPMKMVIFHSYVDGNDTYIYILVGGIPTPLKNDGVSNSWDDDIPDIWIKIKAMFQTTNFNFSNFSVAQA